MRTMYTDNYYIALFVYIQLVVPIVYSVRAENFVYTKWLLDKLDGLVRHISC